MLIVGGSVRPFDAFDPTPAMQAILRLRAAALAVRAIPARAQRVGMVTCRQNVASYDPGQATRCSRTSTASVGGGAQPGTAWRLRRTRPRVATCSSAN